MLRRQLVFFTMVLAIMGLEKPYNLNILIFQTFTGNEPRDGTVCKEASQIAVDNVNNRSDILRNYKITPVYKDEGTTSLLAVSQTINFLNNNTNKLISPIVVGPQSSTGCIRLGSVLHHLDLVNVANGCSASAMAGNRVQFPNMYRIRATADVIIYSRYLFVKQIGKWDRVAILTTASNFRDYTGAIDMQHLLMAQGIHVPWFESVLVMDDKVIQSLKMSDLRIILLEITLLEPVISFLCVAYQNALTGGRYVFVVHPNAAFDLNGKLPKLPGQCDRGVLIEQMKYTFWVGTTMFSTEDNGISSLGYNKKDFDDMLHKRINTTGFADFIIRDACHDATMVALLALNASQESLKEYAIRPTNVISKIKGDIASLHFRSLRVPGECAYSQRIEMDSEIQSTYQWQSEKADFQLVDVVYHNSTMAPNFVESYTIKPTTHRPLWYPPDGKPPQAYSPILIIISDVPQAYSTTVKVISALLLATKSVMIGVNFFQKAKIETFWHLKLAKLSLGVGCLLLDLASIFFVEGNRQPGQAVFCAIRFFSAVVGLALINGGILLAFSLFVAAKKCFHLPIHRGWTTTGLSTATEQIEAKRMKLHYVENLALAERDKTLKEVIKPALVKKWKLTFFTSVSICAIVVNIAIVVAWLVSDPPSSQERFLHDKPVYNAKQDRYEDVRSFVCDSEYEIAWLAAICVLECLMFTVGLAQSFSLHIQMNYGASTMRPYSLAQFNMFSVLIAALIINFLLISQPALLTILHSVISLAISCLVFVIVIGRDTVATIWKSRNVRDDEEPQNVQVALALSNQEPSRVSRSSAPLSVTPM